MSAGVIFRRIGGRIVPILAKAIPGVAPGAVVGALAGVTAGAVAAKPELKELKSKINSHPVNAKKFVLSSGVDATVITSNRDLKKNFGFFRRLQLSSALSQAKQGNNAFALQHDGKNFILSKSSVNAEVLGHELGHIKDFKKNGKLGFTETGILGALTGGTLAREQRAWKMRAYAGHTAEKPALRSYEKGQVGARIGLAVGALSGAAWAFIKRAK